MESAFPQISGFLGGRRYLEVSEIFRKYENTWKI